MKNTHLLVVIAFASAILFGAAESPTTVDLKTLLSKPSDFTGVVEVLGVVGTTSEKTGRLALIEYDEFEKCGVTTCANRYLPVAWKGNFPNIKDLVRVKGRVLKIGAGYLFEAMSIEKAKGTPPSEIKK